jgi:hypothetical protein
MVVHHRAKRSYCHSCSKPLFFIAQHLMDLLSYQRTVFAFHGCDRRLRDAVLTGKKKLNASLNAYDWLGSGIYFWEHGPVRALEWAKQQSKRKGTYIKEPAVLGAIIQLGNCFDLLDVKFTQTLATRTSELVSELADAGLALPANQKAGNGDFDWLRREGDCFVLNSVIPAVESDWDCEFQSVRGVFQEGAAVFKGAGIKLKSHIQIAVRDPKAIIGYFYPEGI